MSCQGKPIEMADLRTAEQKQMMEKMGPLLWSLMGQGATPFGGQLSATPDKGMFDAMNMMSMVGTGKPYTWGGMQTGAYPPASGGMNLPGWGYNWTYLKRGDPRNDPHGDERIDIDDTPSDKLSDVLRDPYAPHQRKKKGAEPKRR